MPIRPEILRATVLGGPPISLPEIVVPNGDWETTPLAGTWTLTGTGGINEQSSALKHTGTYSWRALTDVVFDQKATGQAIDVTGKQGARTIKVWSRRIVGATGPKVAVYDITNSGYLLSPTANGAAGAWTQYSHNFTIPGTCTSIRVELFGIDEEGAECFVDDITIPAT